LKILVTYVTNSGTTTDVAAAIGEEIAKSGVIVETLPLSEVKNLSEYSAVVLGAPMIMGWHRSALKFLRKNKKTLQKKPLALFITAMNITNTTKNLPVDFTTHIDQKAALKPKSSKHFSFKESYAAPFNYLRPILHAAPKSLAAVGFFGGRLDYYRLKWWEALFVMLIIGAKPGEKRNWDDIRSWAAGLPANLKLTS
jgi:menaquinone-dependent protoporphyrinogen oxidase